MKTPMQEMIESIEYRQKISSELYKGEEYTAGYELALYWIKDLSEICFWDERREIIKAAASAYEDMFGTDGTKYGEDYYNKTYPQPVENKYEIQNELIDVLYSQVVDLSMMSRIELGDDVIAKINELKEKLK